MKKINTVETIRTTIANKVNDMTVVEMRQAAKEIGIKNAKKYKRTELSKMIIDAMVAIEEAKAIKVKAKKATGAKKSPKGSNKETERDTDALMAYLPTYDGNSESLADTLMGYGRTVLIRVMKSYKVKGWYRIYDKPTMISKITSAVVA